MEPEIKVNVEMLTALTDKEKAVWLMLGMVYCGSAYGHLKSGDLDFALHSLNISPEEFEKIACLVNKISDEKLEETSKGIGRNPNGTDQE